MSSFHWGYGKDNGPHVWGEHWPIAKKPHFGQSPINIETDKADKPTGAWKRLKIKFRPERCTKLHNNGHSVQVDVAPPADRDSAKAYNLRYGPLKSDYALGQFHFHWGINDSEGSEHTVDGRQYAAEAHFVHYDMRRYSELTQALDRQNGLAVLGVLFKVGKHNKGIQKLLDHFDKILHKGESVQLVKGYNPKWIFPEHKDRQKYWYYYGSLTTPPLHESVNWFVFHKELEMSSEQLAEFRKLRSHELGTIAHDEYHGCIARNFRPPQPKDFRVRAADGTLKEISRRLYSSKKKPRPKKSGQRYSDDSGSNASSDSESSSDSGSDSD